MKHRTAATLVEVLVAIFVMAIGLLALLTLFPLGALRMAQAIKDDRTAHAAANAAAIAEARDIRQNGTIPAALTNPAPGLAVTNPMYLPDLNNPTLLWDGPSYPVYVDPFRMVTPLTGSARVAAVPRGIPRRNTSFTTTVATSVRWFSLTDDLNFNANGVPTAVGTRVQRDNQYSWAYLVRRPKVQVPSVVDLTVVVYSGRTYARVLGEQAYSPVVFDMTSKAVIINWNPAAGQEKPAIRRGSWILDATMVRPSSAPGGISPDPHGFFYRVADVTETGSTSMVIELENFPRLGTTSGVLVVMDNVAEVFEKGPGWKP